MIYNKTVSDYKKVCNSCKIYMVLFIINFLTINDISSAYFSKNGNKYLIFASPEKNKGVFIKYTELWDEIKSLFDKTDDKPDQYGKYFMKIKFNTDDRLPSNKILKPHMLTVTIRSVFQEDSKYYPQVF